ncbi:MAG: O-antigen ligase family protein [Clostridia bacterium]|nr:O-antigen ligase family protein [Clostridia bacterium]
MRANSSKKEKFNKKILPLILLMFVPLIMYFQTIYYDDVITKPTYVQSESYNDLFSFYKSIAIYIVAAMSVLFYFLFTKRDKMELRKERMKYYIPAAVYAVFILISTIFAIYPRAAIFGTYERYEGALILISYLLLMAYAVEVIRNEMDIKYIMYAFLVTTTIISAIGILQFFRLDPFLLPVFKKLIGIPETADIEATFGNMAYSTLYNPNNVGQFSALTVPVVAGLVMAVKEKGWKIFAAAVLVLDLFLAVASKSSNAFAGLIAGGLVLFILMAANLVPRKKKWRIILGVMLIAAILGAAGMIAVNYNRSINSRFVQSELKSIKPDKDDIYFYNIEYKPDNIKIITNQGAFNLSYMSSGIAFFDGEMNFLDFKQNGSDITFEKEPYKSIFKVTIETQNTLTLYAKRANGYSQLEVIFDNEKFLGIRGTGGIVIREVMENQMPVRFRGLETIASRRGYLWIVSAARFDEVIFAGAGPDNFLYWFEQNDIIGKLNMLHRAQILADKPHNWFIQIAVQTGLLSLAAFLALTGIYFVVSFKNLGFRRKKSFYELLGTGLLAGTAGYMASSFFVDSTVGVTPIFYVLIGIGIVCNEAMQKAKEKDRNLLQGKRPKA